MAAAIVDLEINEHETFEMTMAYWTNVDRTLPIDLASWTFSGAFNFGDLCIPITFTVLNNEVLCRIEADLLVDLPPIGSYSIEASSAADIFRIQQGKIRVDREIPCT